MTFDPAPLQSICDQATPGPWTFDPDTDAIRCASGSHVGCISQPADFPCVDADEDPEAYARMKRECAANTKLLTEARTALPEALAEIARLRAELAEFQRRNDLLLTLATLDAKARDKIRDGWLADERTWAAKHAALTKERDDAQKLAEERFTWAHTVEQRTSQAIASFIVKRNPTYAAEILAGAWRTP
jgi:uncharacterized membrane protein